MHPEDVAPGTVLKLPAGQPRQFAALTLPPSLTKVPEGQGVHAAAPAIAEKEPGRHAVHATAPAKALLKPRGHGRHAAALPPLPGTP